MKVSGLPCILRRFQIVFGEVFKLQTYEDFGFDPSFCRQSSLWEGTYMTVFLGREMVRPFPAPEKPDPKISQRKGFNASLLESISPSC